MHLSESTGLLRNPNVVSLYFLTLLTPWLLYQYQYLPELNITFSPII